MYPFMVRFGSFWNLFFLLSVPLYSRTVFCQEDIGFSCSLRATGQRFVCPGETVTYVCSGTGDVIDLYAPPNITSDSSLSFARGNVIGSGLTQYPIIAHLISTDSAKMMASVIVMNSLSDHIIVCEIRSPTQRTQVNHRLSGNVQSHIKSKIVQYYCNCIVTGHNSWCEQWPPNLRGVWSVLWMFVVQSLFTSCHCVYGGCVHVIHACHYWLSILYTVVCWFVCVHVPVYNCCTDF